ncbi:hypothetical protein MESS2_730246 [Mesorhizobium metallidurans STM 2683]|uniref:Uncharacterized protein n=1 Tax=Mesorhizobium metallidurans STM 2683 TaxID=1297569 RepID=M5EWM2_9HYPH|nr:hypothetical protein [Mesorhizobium metallidurans]CCV08350.1 hypothetical protein MESS2_730246 [Mesorhizobium metallidurans STM 2683]
MVDPRALQRSAGHLHAKYLGSMRSDSSSKSRWTREPKWTRTLTIHEVVFRSKKNFVEGFGDPDGDHILLDAFSDLNARVDAVFHQIKVKIINKDFELNIGMLHKEAADSKGRAS